jgi:hypothetical protein
MQLGRQNEFHMIFLASNTRFLLCYLLRVHQMQGASITFVFSLSPDFPTRDRSSDRMTMQEQKIQKLPEQTKAQAEGICLFYQAHVEQAFGADGHMASLKLEVIQDIAPLHAPTSQPHQPPSPAREPEHMFAQTAMQAHSLIMQARIPSHLS